jgi:hypothetical protein
MENARNVGKARVVVTDSGQLDTFVTPEVMYDRASCEEVIRSVLGIYCRNCHSGLIIAFKLAVADATAAS